MKRLIEYTKILRSKNAGPLFLTLDLIFYNADDMEYVCRHLTREAVAKAYGILPEKIEMIAYEVVHSIKITFPRKAVSGSLADNDIYGCQQHMPLANMEV